jgi:hypothetical protein
VKLGWRLLALLAGAASASLLALSGAAATNAPGGGPGVGQGAPQGGSPPAKIDPDMERIATWMTGDFDTFEQVAADEAAGAPYKHMRAVMHIVPVAICGLTCDGAGLAFYVEQAAAEAQDAPYRQRVYLLTRKDGRLINRIFRIGEPLELAGAYKRPALLARLTPDRLTLDEGCDLTWTKQDETLFTGGAGLSGTCKSSLRGATHATSRVELRADSITSLDQGFDDAENHKWGPPGGTIGHVFRKEAAARSGP